MHSSIARGFAVLVPSWTPLWELFNAIMRWRPRQHAPQHGGMDPSQGPAPSWLSLIHLRPWRFPASWLPWSAADLCGAGSWKRLLSPFGCGVGQKHYEVLGQVTRLGWSRCERVARLVAKASERQTLRDSRRGEWLEDRAVPYWYFQHSFKRSGKLVFH